MDSTKISRLSLYENSCGFKYQKDSIIKIESFVIFFSNNSNTQIEEITFSTVNYAKTIAKS